jgi:hypothetical protein
MREAARNPSVGGLSLIVSLGDPSQVGRQKVYRRHNPST